MYAGNMESCFKNESVLAKLAKMFGEFACGKNLSDEALIDNLLAWLETELVPQSHYISFVETTNFWSYVSSCLDSSAVSANQYSFVLRIISCIAARYYMSSSKDVTLLLLRKAWSDKLLWNRACVRVAWLRVMSTLTADEDTFSFSSDDFSVIRSCINDKSWFVRKNATSLMVTIINQLTFKSHFDNECGLRHSYCDTNGTHVCDDINTLLAAVLCPLFDESFGHDGVWYRDDQLATTLEIIHHMKMFDGSVWCSLLATSPHNMVSKFIYLLELCANQLPHGNELVLSGIFLQFHESGLCVQEIQTQIMSLVWSLLRKRNMLVSASIASWAIQWDVKGKDEWFIQLDSIILLPILAALNYDNRESYVTILPSIRQEAWCKAFDCLVCSKRVHADNLKFSITFMLKMVNNQSYVNYLCDFLMATFDQSTRAYHVASNSKLRLLCLDVCSILFASKDVSGNGCTGLCRVFQIILLALNNNFDDHQVLEKALCCMLTSMGAQLQNMNCEHELWWLLTEITPSLHKALSSPSWNVRDTVIEFLQRLLDVHADLEIIQRWVISAEWHHAIWLGMSDTDNFVRATALLALSNLHKCKPLWFNLTSVHVSPEDVRRRALEMLRTDPSEFVRRAAINIVVQWHNGLNTCDEVLLALSGAITDPDREVQLAVVKFWEARFLKLIGDQAQCGSDLLLCKCLDVLISASSDYDKNVRFDSLTALTLIKCKVAEKNFQFTDENATNVQLNVHSMFCNTDWDHRLQLEKLDNSSLDYVNALLDDALTDLMRSTQSTGFTDDVVIDCY